MENLHVVIANSITWGKEPDVWLLLDDGTIKKLYVESHRYRGGDFDVYTASPDSEWDHIGTVDTAEEAFDVALAQIEDSQLPLRGT